jgi:hypothetical protein
MMGFKMKINVINKVSLKKKLLISYFLLNLSFYFFKLTHFRVQLSANICWIKKNKNEIEFRFSTLFTNRTRPVSDVVFIGIFLNNHQI